MDIIYIPAYWFSGRHQYEYLFDQLSVVGREIYHLFTRHSSTSDHNLLSLRWSGIGQWGAWVHIFNQTTHQFTMQEAVRLRADEVAGILYRAEHLFGRALTPLGGSVIYSQIYRTIASQRPQLTDRDIEINIVDGTYFEYDGLNLENSRYSVEVDELDQHSEYELIDIETQVPLYTLWGPTVRENPTISQIMNQPSHPVYDNIRDNRVYLYFFLIFYRFNSENHQVLVNYLNADPRPRHQAVPAA